VRRLHQAHALLKGFAERTPEHPPKRAHRDVLVFFNQKVMPLQGENEAHADLLSLRVLKERLS